MTDRRRAQHRRGRGCCSRERGDAPGRGRGGVTHSTAGPPSFLISTSLSREAVSVESSLPQPCLLHAPVPALPGSHPAPFSTRRGCAGRLSHPLGGQHGRCEGWLSRPSAMLVGGDNGLDFSPPQAHVAAVTQRRLLMASSPGNLETESGAVWFTGALLANAAGGNPQRTLRGDVQGTASKKQQPFC